MMHILHFLKVQPFLYKNQWGKQTKWRPVHWSDGEGKQTKGGKCSKCNNGTSSQYVDSESILMDFYGLGFKEIRRDS